MERVDRTIWTERLPAALANGVRGKHSRPSLRLGFSP